MAVAGSEELQIISLKSFLKKNFKISDLVELSHMLGVLVTWDHPNQLIYLDQVAYIHQIVFWFGMETSAPVSISLIIKHNLSLAQSPKTEAEKCAYKNYAESTHYLSLVCLLCLLPRPDLISNSLLD